jgi:hypothetical protein
MEIKYIENEFSVAINGIKFLGCTVLLLLQHEFFNTSLLEYPCFAAILQLQQPVYCHFVSQNITFTIFINCRFGV